jgi:hypothetical protein
MLPLVFAAVSQGAAAAAPTGDATVVTQLPASREYRNGLVVGLSAGLGLGGASGYPNNVQEIGNSADYSATGLMAGSYTQLYVLGAFSDYVSFGFWLGSGQLRDSEATARAFGIGFRLELFPLVGLVPKLHGLGVLANLGLGSGTIDWKNPNLPESSGTQSFGGIGIFHEWSFAHFLGGHFAVGPVLEFDAVWSQPFEQHGLVASARITFYGAP